MTWGQHYFHFFGASCPNSCMASAIRSNVNNVSMQTHAVKTLHIQVFCFGCWFSYFYKDISTLFAHELHITNSGWQRFDITGILWQFESLPKQHSPALCHKHNCFSTMKHGTDIRKQQPPPRAYFPPTLSACCLSQDSDLLKMYFLK